MKSRLWKWIVALVLALVAAIVFTLLHEKGMHDPSWNARVRTFAKPGEKSDHVQLILLDQTSLDWAENELAWSWPWPREAYAVLTSFLDAGDPAAIFFDVLYTEASVYGVADDQAFGDAIAAAGNFVGAVDVHSATPGDPGVIPALASNAAALATINLSGAGSEKTKNEDEADEIEDETGLTVTDVVLGLDGFPAPAIAMAAVAGAPTNEIPLLPNGRMLLKYRGEADVYNPLSAAAVLRSALQELEGQKPDLDPAQFKDKHILFGFSAPGLMDLRYTPFGKNTPGVHVHATALDNVISRDFIRKVHWAWVLLGIVCLCLLVAAGVLFSRGVGGPLASLLAILAFPVAVGWALYAGGWHWPVLAPLLAGSVSWASALVIRYATEGRERAFITSAFKHYLSDVVIDQILDDPSRLQLGGERRELSIFFSDLQGFSRISERLEPQELTTLLNEYLTDMTTVILASGGTLDKYEGDAILAFWNAPIDQPDHARRAVQSAIDCHEALTRRRAEWNERFKAELHMRIGIHTGEVVVGNMGSTDRFDYTVLGDAANLAARLEGANKQFGTFLMVSGETHRQSEIPAREIGRIRVVGREQAVTVFEPFWSGTAVRPAEVERFAAGLAAAQSGDPSKAEAEWKGMESDPVVAKTLTFLREQAATAAEKTWDGVWNLDSK